MFKAKVLAAFAFAAMSIAASGAAAEPKRISSEAEFRRAIVGKTMRAGSVWFVSRADGALVGEANGTAFRGAWNWQSGFFCRNGAFAGQDPIGTDCQVILLDGAQVTLIRGQGSGKTVIYSLD